MKARLTKRSVKAATYEGPGGCYIWDVEARGFGLRIYPSGRKSFVVTYMSRGRQRFLTIGRHGEMTVKEARAEAYGILARARKGEDPAAERQAARKAPTVADLAERYMTEHAEIKKKARSVQGDRQMWDRHILPRLGQRKVADIARADVAKLLAEMASTPAMANKVLSLLSKAFNLAEIWGWRPEGKNPCRHVGRYREASRERYLSESELKRLGEVLDLAQRSWGFSPYAITAIRLLILTGCRLSEILKLRWQDVDLERKCLHLPDSKTGKKTVRLNSGALQILAGLERVDDNPYVIVGAKLGSHLSSLQQIWNRIREEAELEGVRIHDLRHTFAVRCLVRWYEEGADIDQKITALATYLGHVKVTDTYWYLTAVPELLALAGNRFEDLAGREKGDLV